MNRILAALIALMFFAAGIASAQVVDLPRTGQTTSYAAGDDGNIQAGVAWPSPRFTDNGDGTQTDNLTGLIWLKDANCFSLRTWSDALADANGLADGACGLTDGSTAGDWRLPNLNELLSLRNAEQVDSAAWLMTLGFTNVQSGRYKASTQYGDITTSSWTVGMSLGNPNGTVHGSGDSVWPVRGTSSGPARLWRTGQTISQATGDDGDIEAGAGWPSPRFTDNGNGAVTDNLTGLIWLKDATCFGQQTWAGALSDAGGLADGSCSLTDGSTAGDWRLPNIKELQSLTDASRRDPALPASNPFGIPMSEWSNYWSSTTFSGDSTKAWHYNLRYGRMLPENKIFFTWFWPVRGGGVFVPVPDITVTDAVAPVADLQVPFGNVTENTTADQTVTVTNDGNVDLTLGNIATANPLAAPFSALNDNCSGQTLAPAASCTFDVRFAPTTTGVSNDSLDIPSDDPDENPVTVDVSGTGTPTPVPDITVTDSVAPAADLSVPFGDVTENTASDQQVTVTNDGSADLVLGNVATADPLAAPFSVLNDNCSGQTLAPAASCTFDVRFAPTSTGVSNDSLDIPSDDPDENPVTVAVSGNGTPPVPDITVTDAVAPANDLSVPFGNVTENTTADQAVTVTNDGAGSLMLGNVATANPLAAPFSVLNDSCSGQTLAPAAGCTFDVRFAPTSTGVSNDSLDIPSDDPDENPVTVSVSGTGIPTPVPDITVTDSVAPAADLSVPFGDVTENTTSDQQVTVTNDGNADLTLGNVAVANPLAAPFSVLNDSCSGQTLAPAASCTFDVRFAPTSIGPANDSLDIPSDDPDENPVTVAVSGTGATMPVPDITVTDSLAPADDLRMPFADLTVGGQSDQTVTVTNDGNGDLVLGMISLADPLAAPFSVVNNGCTLPSLAPAATCQLTIRFAPMAAGVFNDSLDIPSNDPDEDPVTVSVSGDGLAGVNNPPSSPQLVSPANGQQGVWTSLFFEWRPATDPDGDQVIYELFNCENPDPLAACVPFPVGRLDDGNDGTTHYRPTGLGLGGGAGLAGLLLFGAACVRRKVPLLTVLVVLSATLLGSCLHDDDDSANVSSFLIDLDPDTTYYWAVVAKDGNGGATPSEVWSYTTR